MSAALGSLTVLLTVIPAVLAAATAVRPLDAVEVARDLESIRTAATPASGRVEARRRLFHWMRAAGLEQLGAGPSGEPYAALGEAGSPSESDASEVPSGAPSGLPTGLPTGLQTGVLTGILPGAESGSDALEALLVVTIGRPEEDTWGCTARAVGLAMAAISELAAVPRRHTVRLLLLERDGTARETAGRWVGALTTEQRHGLSMVIDLDAVASGIDGSARPGAPPGVIRLAPVASRAATGLRLPPGWSVHLAVTAARAVGEPLAVAAPRAGSLAQWLARSTVPSDSPTGDAFLAAGVPAVSLAENGLWAAPAERSASACTADAAAVAARMSAWEPRLTALVRRLDGLAARPRADGEYLALLGRVWSRRDLYWAGLVVWILLVVAGLPGAWRGRSSGERATLGRRYLPGFAARGLVLVTLLALPVLSVFFLLPGAVVWVVGSWLAVPRRVSVAVAVFPWALWSGGIAWLLFTGRAAGLALGLPALLLLGGSFGTMLWALSRDGEAGDAVS